MSDTHFDVIIVGGRPAGSTLAVRLGQHGLRVLLVERSQFPSQPAVSSPAIYSSTMALLDEIGADEAAYARNTPRFRRWVTEVRDDFRSINDVPLAHGRDYGYAIDRARFDATLWHLAAAQPTVTARQPFSVTDILMDGARATGIQGRAPGGPLESYTADLVVGADGRFSRVARKVGARDLEVADTLPVTYLYAYWRNVAPYDAAGDAVVHGYAAGNGVGYLLMDSADDTTAVVLGGRSALLTTTHMGSEALYLHLLHQQPRLWRRFGHAERLTTVRGMRDVGNLYRTASGPGWALVGDALHQVDPLDGQGIFDAVFSAKALSHAIGAWRRGEHTWAAAGACYAAAVRAETEPMFKVTLNRVKTELYGRYPDWAYRTVLRWISTDPAYLQRIGRLLVRAIDPAHARTPRVILGALVRGAVRDLTWQLVGHPRHDALPPLAEVTTPHPPRHPA